MKLCVVSLKDCWQAADGRWVTYGGFPAQMEAICSLFDEAEILVLSSHARANGIPLPASARIVPLRQPAGADLRRKVSVLSNLSYYVGTISRHARKADVVHVPLPGDMPLLGMLVALVRRKRLLARYGGSWKATSITTMTNRFTRACMRAMAGGRNIMIATGEEAQPPAPGMHWAFATALTAEEIQGITPVLDRTLQSPPHAVYAGRLSPEKGVNQLIQAIAQLRSQGFEPLPRLTLLGDGPQRASLEALSERLGCRETIRFAGQVDRPQLSVELRKADFGVHASFTEGLCKSWVDMLAHGLPVVSTAVGAAPAVLGGDGERGWLVPPGDVPALAQRIEQVVRGPVDWPALRRRCRAYAERRTVESWRQRIADICAEAWSCEMQGGKLVAGT